MIFHSKQIKGQGRGHTIGLPTINLEVPADLILDEGVYAAWVGIRNKTYKGALHFGPVPTFNQNGKTLEVHLLVITDETAPVIGDTMIEVDTVEYLREVVDFAETEDLLYQVAQDIEKVGEILG